MPTPDLREADFLAALHALLPQGAAWPREPGTVLDMLLSAMAQRAASQHARIGTLADEEAFPPAASEMLSDWERTYGLPDGCGSEGDSTAQRRAALLARIAERGGQSRGYFIGVAAALGFTVTIEEFRPFRVGRSRVGDRLHGPSWLYTWRIRAPEATIVPFRVGISRAGDPLRSWGNERLECVIRRISPAHTTVLFAYS